MIWRKSAVFVDSSRGKGWLLSRLRNRQIRASTRFQESRRGNRSSAAAFACLIGLLVQFFLPSVHTCSHLLEDAATPAEIGVERSPSGEPSNAPACMLISEAEAASRHSHHDPSSCPVCQTLLHASIYVASHHCAALSAPKAIRLLPPALSDENASGCYLTGCNPRAPPDIC